MTSSILADIGGTNIRFATLSPEGGISHREAWLTALYPDLADALQAYRNLAGHAGPLSAIAICAAGPLIDGAIDLTNCTWKLSLDGVHHALFG